MVALTGIFNQFDRKKILVVGDLMLDAYTTGRVSRISPEAPICILKVEHQDSKPGGAGNVMLNLASLGMEVFALGRVGQDSFGEDLIQILSDEGINTSGIYRDIAQATIVKNRIIADNQQLLRVDHEDLSSLSQTLEDEITGRIPYLMENIDLVAISDYDKGFLTESLLQSMIRECKKRKIPVVVDPKGRDFKKYRGATLIKPNISEALTASGLSSSDSLEMVAGHLFQQAESQFLMITRSQDGVSCFERGKKEEHFPAKIKEVNDVTGAGDTVLSMVAAALANKLSLKEAAQLANIAAGIAIEALGCARVSLAQVAKRLLEEDTTHKVFDEKHVFALEHLLKENPYQILALHCDAGLTPSMYQAIQKTLNGGKKTLVIYIQDRNPNPIVIQLLATLREVSFIILKKESFRHFCQILLPQKVYSFEEEGLQSVDFSSFLTIGIE